MLSKLKRVIFLLLLFFLSNKTFSQSLSRTVVCSAGESFRVMIGGNNNNHDNSQSNEDNDEAHTRFSISYTLGEDVAGLLGNPYGGKLVNTGFQQIDDNRVLIFGENEKRTLEVYPNPVAGSIVKIAMDHVPSGSYKLQITNSLGVVIQTQNVYYAVGKLLYIELDVSRLNAGYYFVSLTNESYQGGARFIKML